MAKQTWICSVCGGEFTRYRSQVRDPARVTCSRDCQAAQLSIEQCGKANPNYGHRWSTAQRRRASKRVRAEMQDPRRRLQSGNANRGKKFSPERVRNMHSHRSADSYRRSHNAATRKKIGVASAAKFKSPEFRRRHRATMVARGLWLPAELRTAWSYYMAESDWRERMFDRANRRERRLLRKFGVFNAASNPTGAVRDHRYSRRSGFEHGVFPELLRHPCNCAIITHSDNAKKRWPSSPDSLSLSELFAAILAYRGVWKEQLRCLELIREYDKGSRYVVVKT